MYEPETQRIFNKVLEEGDRCIIAGAHQGLFVTLAASLVGPSGRVYGFEPERENFSLLKENTQYFHYPYNIFLYNLALGEVNRKAPFFVNKDNDGGHALFDVRKFAVNVKTIAEPESYTVDVKRLDDVLEDEDLSRLRLCLFDVEGAEHSVLKGAINTITDNEVPYIICEINNPALEQCNTSQKGLRDYMAMYGYKTYLVQIDGVFEINKDFVIKQSDYVESVFNVLFSRVGPV
jgi:FkbM family methyltransferase